MTFHYKIIFCLSLITIASSNFGMESDQDKRKSDIEWGKVDGDVTNNQPPLSQRDELRWIASQMETKPYKNDCECCNHCTTKTVCTYAIGVTAITSLSLYYLYTQWLN